MYLCVDYGCIAANRQMLRRLYFPYRSPIPLVASSHRCSASSGRTAWYVFSASIIFMLTSATCCIGMPYLLRTQIYWLLDPVSSYEQPVYGDDRKPLRNGTVELFNNTSAKSIYYAPQKFLSLPSEFSDE